MYVRSVEGTVFKKNCSGDSEHHIDLTLRYQVPVTVHSIEWEEV